MKRTMLMIAVGLTGALILAIPSSSAGDRDERDDREQDEFSMDFPLDECTFKSKGANRFFSLEPGYQLFLAGEDDGEMITVLITVLSQKRTVQFEYDGEPMTVKTRVIEEREFIDGELYEVSRNYFARCKQTNDIYYFGEEVDFYEDGEIVGNDGAWLAGEDGALPGIIMPGSFLLGSRYFQELAPGIALDRAEHAESGVTVDTPAGTFEDCVIVAEDSALEPDAESEKIYAPGVGLIQDDELQLIWYGFDGADGHGDDDGHNDD